VLSAFVLCNTIKASLSEGTAPMLAGYAIRRAFRLWPLAAAVVLTTFSLFWWSRQFLEIGDVWPRYDTYTWDELYKNLVFLSSSFNPPGWTLKYEVAGYAIIPFVFIATREISPRSLVCACIAIVLLVFFWQNSPNWLLFFQAFAVGILAFLIHERTNGRDLTPICIYVGAAALFIRTFQPDHFAWTAVTSTAIAAVMLMMISSKRLTAPPIRWLGQVSYSVYLVHYPVMWAMTCALNKGVIAIADLPTWLALGAISIPLTLLISHCSFYLIEKPAMRLGGAIANSLSYLTRRARSAP
jgi:peptidoglycan/LPS O-acetylase OafA/YrhL